MPNQSWNRPADDGEAIFFALRHPLRRRILAVLAAGASSPKRLSRRLEQELSLVSYHARALKFYGLIKVVETASVRGSVEHFYETTDLGRRGLALAETAGLIDEQEGGSGEEEGGEG